MASFNRVILLGNLTRDPELKYLPSNTAVCDFGMAMNHRWRDKDGNQKEDVCFVDVSAFGKPAEIIKQYMAKGRSLLVEGRLKLDTWTAQDGTKRSKHSVIVENFQFVGSREGGQGGGPAGGAPYDRATPPARSDAPPQRVPAPAAGPAFEDEVPPPTNPDIPF